MVLFLVRAEEVAKAAGKKRARVSGWGCDTSCLIWKGAPANDAARRVVILKEAGEPSCLMRRGDMFAEIGGVGGGRRRIGVRRVIVGKAG